MNMSLLVLIRLYPATARLVAWLLDLAIRMLARALNMPEPLVRNTGVIVFAHVQAVENGLGKTLRPIRLLRRLLSLREQVR
jgi:hypothetical protein